MKRKFAAFFMVLVLVFSMTAMTGCTNDDADKNPGQTSTDNNGLNDGAGDNGDMDTEPRDADDDLTNRDRNGTLGDDLAEGADDLGDDIRDGAEDVKDGVEDMLDGNDAQNNNNANS